MKADVLKKHHYWLVAVASVFLVLLSFFMLSGGVSEAIDKEQGEIKKAADAAKTAQAPGAVALTAIEKQKKDLEERKNLLWKENWDNQKKLFAWPSAPDNMFDEYNELKFGDPLKDYSDYKADVFRRETVYKEVYEQMAASIAPTKFAGSWQAVLGEHFVANWGDKKPDSRQLWLAMENIWVQRALLAPIKQVNDTAAIFKLVDVAAPPLSRAFENRIWRLSLDVVDQGAGKLIKAKLKNLTNQMQLLGSGSTLTLKIWLDADMNNLPVDFKIEGEYVPGDAEIIVNPLPGHTIPAGVTVTELAKVEQVLDERTVPVREVSKMSIKWLSGRDAKALLLPPEFWKDEAAADGTTPAGGAPTAPPTAGASSGGVRGEGSPPRGDFAGGGIATAGPVAAGGTGTPTSAIDNQRKRYLEVNGQLRRIPVAIKLVLDLRYKQDIMVAYTNSPLRFQITQYHFARFRGNLGTDAAPSTGGTSTLAGGAPANFDIGPAVSGTLGEELRGMRGARGGPPAASPMAGASEGPFNRGFIPGLQGGALSSVSDAQANSALVELYLFGIVTLYEKYEAKKDPNAPPPEAAPAAPVTPPPPGVPAPAETAPAPKSPVEAPKDPATPAPTSPPVPKL